ncbi:MAG: MCE family protein [Acetobacter sp.]|nr:MCE family protein [Acetobacter sp.]
MKQTRVHKRLKESFFSGAILLGTAFFVVYALDTQHLPHDAGTNLTARFISANGLSRGSDVAIAGVKVGRVTAVTLDPQSQMAMVHFFLEAPLRIPQNSLLTIGRYTPTAENALLITPTLPSHKAIEPRTFWATPQTPLTNTQEPISLEQQISNYIFNIGNLK